VAPSEALADRIGVLDSVGVAVMGTVAARPPTDGALDSTGTNGGKVEAERERGLVAAMSPEAVIACLSISDCSADPGVWEKRTGGDAETGIEVVDDSKYGRVAVQRSPVRGNQPAEG